MAANDARRQLRGIVAIADCPFCRPDFGWIHQRVAVADVVAAGDGGGGGGVAK